MNETQFAMMNELLDVNNKIERLNSEDSKNCCTNLRDEIKHLKEEMLSKNLIIKILAETRINLVIVKVAIVLVDVVTSKI